MWDELMQPYPLGLGCDEEEACRITQSERDNLDLVAEVVEKERLDVDFWRGDLLESMFILKVFLELTDSTPLDRAVCLEQGEVRGMAGCAQAPGHGTRRHPVCR